MKRTSQLRRTRLKQHDAGQHKVAGVQQYPKGLARTKRLPPASSKRLGEAAQRRLVVAEVLSRDGNACRAPAALLGTATECPVTVCSGPLDAHEVIRRSAWRAGYLVPANIRTLCRAHHRWVTEHPLAAIDAGLAAPSTAPRPTT